MLSLLISYHTFIVALGLSLFKANGHDEVIQINSFFFAKLHFFSLNCSSFDQN